LYSFIGLSNTRVKQDLSAEGGWAGQLFFTLQVVKTVDFGFLKLGNFKK
jgi:hypothetical protein